MDYLEYRRRIKLEGKPPAQKKIHKIRRQSKKRAKINRGYYKVSRPMWRNQSCEIKSPECSGAAQGIHHIAGKVTTEMLMDKNNWKASCNSCNSYMERFPEWAKVRGFKKSRLTKNFSPSRSLEDRVEDLPF